MSDPCVYTFGQGNDYAMMTLYVDDLVVTGGNTSVLKTLRDKLKSRFEMSDLGEASLVLGMKIERDKRQDPSHFAEGLHTTSTGTPWYAWL